MYVIKASLLPLLEGKHVFLNDILLFKGEFWLNGVFRLYKTVYYIVSFGSHYCPFLKSLFVYDCCNEVLYSSKEWDWDSLLPQGRCSPEEV